MSATTTPPKDVLLTAEEYARCAPSDCPSELVKGRIVRMNPPFSAHGYWCNRFARFLDHFVEEHQLGSVLTNDSGVQTERDPDTVRGMDIAFYSYQRVPAGPPPEGYWPAPEIAVEIRSPDDRWPRIHRKVSEYQEIGVLVVCVVDPPARSIHVFAGNNPVVVLNDQADLTFPDVLPGFTMRLADYFRR